MKLIKKIALGVCALAMCGVVFFGCSNAASGADNSLQTRGGSPLTSGSSSGYTEVWSGSTVIAWSINESGEFVSADKLTNAKGLRITYTTDGGESHCVKFLQGDSWEDIMVSSVEGDGMIANSGADVGKAIWPWKDQTNATFSMFWVPGSEDATKVLSKGIKVYGDGVTLTKIETIAQ